MSKLIILSAPSGAGKTTLCQRLLRDFGELTLSISCTTRAPRGQEKDGVDYYFLRRDEFEKKIKESKFAEWALVHSNYYGTSKEVIEQCFARGQSVLLDIDVQGADSLRRAYPSESYSVFISPPSMQVLEERLRNRKTDAEETIKKRLRNAAIEMKEATNFHVIVINDDLERAYSELQSLVESQLRPSAGPGGIVG